MAAISAASPVSLSSWRLPITFSVLVIVSTPWPLAVPAVDLANPPAIGLTRRYQTLQALVNCTRRSLLPEPDIDEEQRDLWREQLRQLELRGIE